MRFSIKILFSLVPFCFHLSQARPQGGVNTYPCFPETSYEKSGEQDVIGTPFQLPVSCTPIGGACNVGTASSYTVSITVTVGGGLNLDLPEIGGLSASASVSKTTANGVTDNTGATCAGPWACSAIITPTVVEISGTKTSYNSGGSCARNENKEPYTVQFPKLGLDNNPVVNLAPCACKNKEHWADAGAPPPCLSDC